MSSTQSSKRPQTLHVSKSFSRMEPSQNSPISPSRTRASTIQASAIPAVPEAREIPTSPEVAGKTAKGDVFESQEEDGKVEPETDGPDLQLPETFDELPIEIRSIAERFLESLSAKVHPTPLSVDQLSDLFQDFYARANSHIDTHIATLASRISREKSPARSISSKTSAKGRSRAGSGADRSPADTSGGEMLTASEITDRRKQRRLLEIKKLALEEAVERGVCEKIYDRIWRHRSTDDEERDEKLRSRTAALSVVGIGLKELHVDVDPAKDNVHKTAEEKEQEINHSLASAREALQHMNDERYPLGKLQHLTAAHKSIVETLSQLFPSSSSADEILPTLIYTLITSPPEGINVVSNLHFVQRFRASGKVDGEAAYCLVNLEAAISFLETVDLSSLRADEVPEGPPKSSSRPTTPTAADKTSMLSRPPVAKTLTPGVSPVSAVASEPSPSENTALKALPSPSTPTPSLGRPAIHQRRLSSLIQQQADRIEAGRENFLNTADQAFDTINNTLENSFKFVFGRFTEQTAGDSPLPKTLEDARKLVSSPAVLDEDALSNSGRSSVVDATEDSGIDDPLINTGKSQMLDLVGGRRQLRDRSADSTRSGGSGKRVAFSDAAKEPPQPGSGNLFNSFNPLSKIGVPGFARFGRSASLNSPTITTPTTEKRVQLGDIVESPVSAKNDHSHIAENQRNRDDGGDDLNAAEALAELKRIKPPKKRFLEVKDASELRLGEVQELLMEYRRLAKAIGEAIAS